MGTSREDVRCKALRVPICHCVKKLKPRQCWEADGPEKKELTDDTEKNVVILERTPNTTCTINLQGATITSWRIENEEQLFVGMQTKYSPHFPIRGGISLAFPFCGPWSFGPRLGSTRKIRWRILVHPERMENGDIQAAFIVCDSAYTRSMWCNNFWLCFWVILQESSLHLRYYVFNTNNVMPFECTPTIMISLLVPDVQQCVLVGVKDCEYTDDENGILYLEEDNDEIYIKESINRLYCDTPDLFIEDISTGRVVSFIKDQPDTTVWNPWTGENSNMCFYTQVYEEVDFNEGDHMNMLRLAFGHVRKPISLNPNEHYIGHLVIKAQKPRDAQLLDIERKSRTSRVVPEMTRESLFSNPQLPRFSRYFLPRISRLKCQSLYSSPSLTDVPFMIAEEIMSKIVKHRRF